MSRPVRVEYPGAYYHVMHRGLDRQKVFLGDADYREFVALSVGSGLALQLFYYLLCPRGRMGREILEQVIPNKMFL